MYKPVNYQSNTTYILTTVTFLGFYKQVIIRRVCKSEGLQLW